MDLSIKRLLVVCSVLACATAIDVELATTISAAPVEAQAIADHLSSVKSMSGDFVQTSPRGEKTSGRFLLQRPGKIRFNYGRQSGVSVIADGKSLVVLNRKLKTSRLYALSKTPLKLLLDNNVDFSGRRLKSIRDDGAQVTIRLADKSSFGNSTITLVFDRKSLDLRRWSVTDEKGLATTVSIFNVKEGVAVAAENFVIDYTANREFNTRKK